MSQCYVVLAMHRTRSSMVAEMLDKMGIHMGDELLGGGTYNPWGQWEDVHFYQLHREILHQAGGRWDSPPPESKILDASQWLIHDMRWLIDWKSDQHPRWGFKDPRTILFVRRWNELLPHPRYVIVRRDREDVIDSLHNRAETGGVGAGSEYTRDDWANLYDDYHSRLREFLEENECPAIGVDTDLFMDKETAPSECARLADFVGGNARKAYEAIRFKE